MQQQQPHLLEGQQIMDLEVKMEKLEAKLSLSLPQLLISIAERGAEPHLYLRPLYCIVVFV